MTLAERTQYHLAQYHITQNDFHRAACDYFFMAQASIDQHDIKGATYRYRQGVHYAQEAVR